jgi:RNA polymerase sigma-70 factor, ECF subfamily
MVKEKEFELVTKFINGDERSFNELVLQYQKIIYWHARRMVGNHLDADEVTQQVIIVLYNKLRTFKFNSALKTWIYKITQTRCLNMIKKRNIKQFFNLEDAESMNLKNNEDIISNFEDRERLAKLNNVLEKLPVKQRQVFVLRHYEELSYDEISEITGKSVGGLKANYFHASKKIFGMMEDEE